MVTIVVDHNVDHQYPQVMPGMLSYREFPPLQTFKQLQPGYRESPQPNQNMVVMFLRVVKPKEVLNAQHCFTGEAEEEEVEGVQISADSITAATRALEQYVAACVAACLLWIFVVEQYQQHAVLQG